MIIVEPLLLMLMTLEFISLWILLTYIAYSVLHSRPMRKFLSTVFRLPFTLLAEATSIVQFTRLAKGLPIHRRVTPMIGFPKYRWCRSHLYGLATRMIFMAESFHYWGGMHLANECQTGQPCITFYGLKSEKQDTATKTWQLFTVELLHHIFTRMDSSGRVNHCFEHIHGEGPYPRIIKPGSPYSHPKKQ
jgi:hypothetical protein